jgi:hypothetical protein
MLVTPFRRSAKPVIGGIAVASEPTIELIDQGQETVGKRVRFLIASNDVELPLEGFLVRCAADPQVDRQVEQTNVVQIDVLTHAIP